MSEVHHSWVIVVLPPTHVFFVLSLLFEYIQRDRSLCEYLRERLFILLGHAGKDLLFLHCLMSRGSGFTLFSPSLSLLYQVSQQLLSVMELFVDMELEFVFSFQDINLFGRVIVTSPILLLHDPLLPESRLFSLLSSRSFFSHRVEGKLNRTGQLCDIKGIACIAEPLEDSKFDGTHSYFFHHFSSKLHRPGPEQKLLQFMESFCFPPGFEVSAQIVKVN